MLPSDPWEQTAGLLLDFPAGLRQAGVVAGSSTVPGGLIDSDVHWVASTTKGFMLPLTGQQIEIHMELTADKAVERTFS